MVEYVQFGWEPLFQSKTFWCSGLCFNLIYRVVNYCYSVLNLLETEKLLKSSHGRTSGCSHKNYKWFSRNKFYIHWQLGFQIFLQMDNNIACVLQCFSNCQVSLYKENYFFHIIFSFFFPLFFLIPRSICLSPSLTSFG